MTFVNNIRKFKSIDGFNSMCRKEKLMAYVVSLFMSVEFYVLLAAVFTAGAFVSIAGIEGYVDYMMQGYSEAIVMIFGLGLIAVLMFIMAYITVKLAIIRKQG